MHHCRDDFVCSCMCGYRNNSIILLFWIYRENLYFSEFAGTKDDLVSIVERLHLQPSLIPILKSKSHTFDANLHSLPPPVIFSVLSLSHIESELP